MFAPTKIWRKWHVKVNQNQRRFAVVSAVAATAVPSLVLARGHKIEGVSEIPLVVSSSVESIQKTKEAVAALQGLQAHADVAKVINSKKVRAGKGKARNRKYRQRRGPLVIYGEDKGIVKAFRNIPGVETANVRSLNLLTLAPGGHLGRFVIWTESAFAQLDEVFGTFDKPSTLKNGYKLPLSKVTATNITDVIQSEEIQAVVREAGQAKTKRALGQRKNPLRNRAIMFRLNPYAKTAVRKSLAAEAKAKTDDKKTKAPGHKSERLNASAEFKAGLLSA
jgi:large subunit ribosomal protein L4e